MSTAAHHHALRSRSTGPGTPPGPGATPPPIPWTTAMSQQSLIVLPAFAGVIAKGEYTWEFWMYVAGVNGTAFHNANIAYTRFSAHIPYDGIFYYDSGSQEGGRLMFGPDGSFYYQWRHIAMTFGGSPVVQKLYVDGVLKAQKAHASLANGMYLPSNPDPSEAMYLTGQQGPMGEVRYWDHVRSPAQINALKDFSVQGPTPGLVAAWRCNERGTNVQIVDRSGNNYHGFN
jgi:hypothetical protein